MYSISFLREKRVAMEIYEEGWSRYDKDYYSESEDKEEVICNGVCTCPLEVGKGVNLVGVSGFIIVDVSDKPSYIEIENNECTSCPLTCQNKYLRCKLEHMYDTATEKNYMLTIGEPDTDFKKGSAVDLRIFFTIINNSIKIMKNRCETKIGTFVSDIIEMDLHFNVQSGVPTGDLILVKKN